MLPTACRPAVVITDNLAVQQLFVSFSALSILPGIYLLLAQSGHAEVLNDVRFWE